MSTPILMPALSPTMEEGTLAKWHVKEGDTVEAGQIIAEIETDKATMDFEAVDEGVIEKILVPEGSENVKVQTPIAQMRMEGEEGAKVAESSPQRGKGREGGRADVGAHPISPPPPGEGQTANGAAGTTPTLASGEGEQHRIFVSPLARRLAREAGVKLESLHGSGPHGRIVKADIEAAAKPQAKTEAPAPKQEESKPQAPASDGRAVATPAHALPMPFKEGEFTLQKMDGMRKAIARRMTASFRDVPHFPITIDVEIDKLLSARKQLNGRLEKQGVKLSVNDMLIRACALSLIQVPDSNVSFAGDAIAHHKHAHVAVAVAIPGGLVTPVLFYAEQKGLAQISQEIKALAEKARARKLLPQDYEGGTFTISNLGMMGIKNFASILNEPQAMILSVGAGESRPVVRDGALQIATLMTLTLTCDHRAVDGAIGAEFLAALRALIEDPMMMMA